MKSLVDAGAGTGAAVAAYKAVVAAHEAEVKAALATMAGLRREHFATNAPIEVPSWFEPISTEDKPRRPLFDDFPKEIQQDREKMREAKKQYHRDVWTWEQKKLSVRYFRWRWYYADMMIGQVE